MVESRPPTVPDDYTRGALAWFARNEVAANLLMVAIVCSGIVVAGRIRQEVYPAFAMDVVDISMEYRGASPEEVERSIILPIEACCSTQTAILPEMARLHIWLSLLKLNCP